jgi:hypothetical protein
MLFPLRIEHYIFFILSCSTHISEDKIIKNNSFAISCKTDLKGGGLKWLIMGASERCRFAKIDR